MEYSTPDRYHHVRETAEPVPEKSRPPDPDKLLQEREKDSSPKKRPLWLRFIIQLVRLILALAFVSFAVKVTGLEIR